MSLHPLDGKQFRARLVLLRNAKGLKQEQLSERIGRAYNYISRVETGRVKTVPFDVLAKIALALDVTVDDLLFVDGLAESSDEIKARIQRMLDSADTKMLRKFYRLLLLMGEERD
ncbi:helix-turn-helix transcriptional regulator [Edaphobacter sp. HDX4]|uniref:helix-turn-helix domain-containing protein n=1 Tax=Edaphobacter sp. HDX4 TaxID=2794064 RepID=UPI002FE57808